MKLRITGQTIYAAVVGLVCLAGVGYMVFERSLDAQQTRGGLRLDQIPFNGTQAYKYLQQICAIGTRVSGSPGMAKQQQLLADHFTALGATVERQEFRARHPINGSAVPMANLIVHWHPDRNQRLLVCTHYDTRPWPDRDPRNPRGTFLGANDGGSGTAILMELGKSMSKLEGTLGVDFVFFDGEELVYREPPDEYFLGSTYFAREYVAKPPPYRYRAGVLLDMVGDMHLQVYVERKSQALAPQVVQQVWSTAQRLGVREFVYQQNFEVRDDHLPLNEIAKIPTIDIIDFDYPHWHTEQDRPTQCSALSLAKVGWVVEEWLKTGVR
ncbi:MAG TPA: M28 family peptidase [Pirellulales bacterium]|jgi:hypothetical protein|nr:M28 family peptidase [Pirellulales bacterium]